jgi:hypothetical protein
VPFNPEKVIYSYLDRGISHNTFARIICKDCGHEYLLAFSWKRAIFAPYVITQEMSA